MTFRLILLGGVSLERDGTALTGRPSQRRRLALLALLAASREQGLSRDKLLAYLWPERDIERARHSLSQTLYAIRQDVGVDLVLAGIDDLRLNSAIVTCDLWDVRAALSTASWNAALASYGGPFLDGFFVDEAPEFERWADDTRMELSRAVNAAAWGLADASRERGDARSAIHWGRRAVALDPLGEDGVRRLLGLLVGAGERAGALQTYHEFAIRLAAEFEVEPAPETRALLNDVAQDPARLVSSTSGTVETAVSAATATVQVASRNAHYTSWAMGLVAFAIVGTVTATVSHRGDHSFATALDPNLVAVAPFDVVAADSGLWREGMMQLLSYKLDGAGALRTVPPALVLRRWSGAADSASLNALGHATGAGLCLVGQLAGDSGSTVRLSARIVELGTGAVLGEVDVRGDINEVARLSDTLTLHLLEELGRVRAVGAVRLAALGGAALPTLKHFLRGEQFYRRGAWDAAIAEYELVLREDSTFLPALRHFHHACGWGWKNCDHSLRDLYRRRVARGIAEAGLGPRDMVLMKSDSLLDAMNEGDSTTRWAPLRDLVRLSEAARPRFPTDVEIQWLAAETRQELGAGTGVWFTLDAVMDAYNRTIALDSGFAPAYVPPLRYAVAYDPAAARNYAAAYVARQPEGRDGEAMRLAQLLLAAAPGDPAIRQLLQRSPPDLLLALWFIMRRWTDSAETMIDVARLTTEPQAPLQTLTYRGHLHEAYELIAPTLPEYEHRTQRDDVFASAALLGGVPREVAARTFAHALAHDALPPSWALPWWAAQGDSVSIRRFLTRIDSLLHAARPWGGHTLWENRRSAALGYLALVRQDSTEAARRFDAMPDSLGDWRWYVPEYDLTRARLLAARGRERDALVVLERRPAPFAALAVEGIWALERGRIAARLGDRAQALTAFRFVTEVWRHADPELQGFVDEAKRGVEEMSARRADY